jgi:carbamoyl-phosphate synthase small subunit
MLTNGPGDPAPCAYAIAATRKLLGKLPLFGICLGHQLLGLAVGGKTSKLHFGHHGMNHPVKDLDSGRVLITSQNHGFCVDPDTLPPNARATHWNLNDNTLEGLALTDAPAFSVQFHPEAAPGTWDAYGLFGKFRQLIEDF